MPELPEGYREDGPHLIKEIGPNGWRMATSQRDGVLIAGGYHYPMDAKALAIWLQRRAQCLAP